MYKRFWKRLIDTVLSLIAFIILSPLLLIAALAVKLSSPGPVLFKQQRLGLHGKVFTIYKFRSMSDGAEHTGSGVYSGKGDPRVTKVGKLIRATSIDELPQLINIIVGDMAIVGPRPPLTYHPWPVDQYSEEQFHMFDVRPGITGWARTRARPATCWLTTSRSRAPSIPLSPPSGRSQTFPLRTSSRTSPRKTGSMMSFWSWPLPALSTA